MLQASSKHSSQDHEQLYVGVRREGEWKAYPIEELTEAHLCGIDLHTDVQASLVAGAVSLDDAAAVVVRHAAIGLDPHVALQVRGYDCAGLALLRARLRGV